MRNLLGVEISAAVLEIQQHIHRMGIVLHLGGSMSSVPHVRLPLDALGSVSGQFHNDDGVQTSGYRKVMVCLYNPLNTPSLQKRVLNRIKLTVASMWHGRVLPFSENK